MIQKLDLVALLTDRPTAWLYEVEFINAKGDTVAVETLDKENVKAVDLGRVMLHYSDLENAA